MLGKILQAEIEQMVLMRDFRGLHELLVQLEPADVADMLADLPDEDVAIVFRMAPKSVAAEVFAELEPPEQEALLRRLPHEKAGEIIASLDPDERTAVLDDLPSEVTRRLLEALSPEELAVAQKLLAYPEDSVGRRMTPKVLAISETATAAEGVAAVRASNLPHDDLRTIYLLDAKGRLSGAMSLARLVRATSGARLGEIAAVHEPATLLPTIDQEEAVHLARKYDLVSVPVVDPQGLLLGAVTVDDLLDAAEEEATEDIHRLGGVVGTNPEIRYLDQTVLAHIRARAPWVVVLAAFGILSGEIIAHFGDYIQRYVILAVFMPMLAGTGGNVGSQAATVVIRALSLGEIQPALRDLIRIMRKELLISLGVAAGVGAIVFARVHIYAYRAHGNLLGGYGLGYLGLTITVAMMLQVLTSTLIGAVIPLAVKHFRIDPAVVASPAIATTVDITGLFIYFATARVMLG